MNTMRLHISLNTPELTDSIAFYQALLGVAPIKHKDDYAKFELDAPRMNIALNASSEPQPSGSLSHLGFQVDSTAELERLRQRIQHRGFETQVEEGTCCYAKQSKFWITDPSGVAWEVYLVLEDSDDKGESKVLSASATSCC